MGPGFFYRRRRLDRRMLVRALALSVVVGVLTLVITAAVQMRPLLAIQYRHPDRLRGRVPGHRGRGDPL